MYFEREPGFSRKNKDLLMHKALHNPEHDWAIGQQWTKGKEFGGKSYSSFAYLPEDELFCDKETNKCMPTCFNLGLSQLLWCGATFL